MTFKEVDYQKHVVIGSPLVGWKMDANEGMQWLENSHEIIERFPNVKYFAALELDHRGIEPFAPLIDALKSIGGEYWTYTINDFEEVVDHNNRWIRIETGRNLVREYAQRKKRMINGVLHMLPCDAILYLDSDVIINAQALEKMLEVDRHMVGIDVPAYCLHGHTVNLEPRIEEHWTTAGCLLVNAPACWDLPWYHRIDLGLSDDPTFQHLGERLYGQTWVRKDMVVDHVGRLTSVEHRGIPRRVLP